MILVGRLFKEEGEWIYEKFNYAYMEEDFPDLVTKLAEMEPLCREYVCSNMAQITEEQEKLAENKKQEAERAAQRGAPKQNKRQSKKKVKEEEKEEKPDEEDEDEKKR